MARWKPSDKTGFVFAVLFGALIGVMAGIGHFDPYAGHYVLHVGLWGLAGFGFGVIAGALRRLLRNRGAQ